MTPPLFAAGSALLSFAGCGPSAAQPCCACTVLLGGTRVLLHLALAAVSQASMPCPSCPRTRLDDVLQLLDTIGSPRQFLVGSSMGAWLALHAALRRPHLVQVGADSREAAAHVGTLCQATWPPL